MDTYQTTAILIAGTVHNKYHIGSTRALSVSVAGLSDISTEPQPLTKNIAPRGAVKWRYAGARPRGPHFTACVTSELLGYF